MKSADFNKRFEDIPIFTCWLQGVNNAPFIVQSCINSMIEKNPGNIVAVYDNEKMMETFRAEGVDWLVEYLSPQVKTDILRLLLLRKYGGIWLDATVYCRQSLSTWHRENSILQSNFFAFKSPGRDRIIANWYLFANKQSCIVEKLAKNFVRYWIKKRTHRVIYQQKKDFYYWPIQIALSRCPWVWALNPIKSVLPVYPYFIFHYMFEKNIRFDRNCAREWGAAPKHHASAALLANRIGLKERINDKLVECLSSEKVPIFKLDWRLAEVTARDKGTIVNWICNQRLDI